MTKSELIERITERHPELSGKDIELAVKTILDTMSQALSQGDRIEIRGFGSFSLHLKGKYVPHFKPGKELREQVNHNV